MSLQQILKFETEALGITITEEQLDKFRQYFTLLVEWNTKVNLTSITEPLDVARKHFLDSMLLLKDIDFNNIYSVIDVGTGAGFPGLPIKIMVPHIQLTLLDSLQKRCAFLEEVKSSLGLENVKVIHERAEIAAHKPEHREKYDLATARAVAQLRIIAEYCVPYVKMNGYFVAPKGSNGKQEAEEAKNALDLLGAKINKINTYQLPGDAGTRINIITQKVSPTTKNYPRKAGTPEKKPL